MTKEEIKKEVETCYDQINVYSKRLEKLRSECKHESTFESNYMSRPGNIQPAILCVYCSKLLQYK